MRILTLNLRTVPWLHTPAPVKAGKRAHRPLSTSWKDKSESTVSPHASANPTRTCAEPGGTLDWQSPQPPLFQEALQFASRGGTMSAWKLVTNFAIPPALILTVLLILPTPRVIKKGLLIFTRNVLFFQIAGNFRLVHVMIVLTGMALTACSVHTYKLSSFVLDDGFTPNQRMAHLAKKWREERNFWIALLSFLLWANLNRLYSLILDHARVQERNATLESELSKVKQALSKEGLLQGVAAPAHAEPSAPPEPPGEGEATGGLSFRGKKKAT